MLTHGCSISFVTLLGFQKLPAGLEIASASNQAGVLNHYRTFLKKYRNNLQQEHTSTLKNRQRHIDLKANMAQQVWEGPYQQLNYQNTAQLQYRAAKELLWKFS